MDDKGPHVFSITEPEGKAQKQQPWAARLVVMVWPLGKVLSLSGQRG